MFLLLVRKELLSNLKTFRPAVALLFTVFLAALTTLIDSLDYSRNRDAYERGVRKAREMGCPRSLCLDLFVHRTRL